MSAGVSNQRMRGQGNQANGSREHIVGGESAANTVDFEPWRNQQQQPQQQHSAAPVHTSYGASVPISTSTDMYNMNTTGYYGNNGTYGYHSYGGVGEGTWSNGTDPMTFLGGYPHDSYSMDGMFGPSTTTFSQATSFGQPPSTFNNYFPSNGGDYSAWGNQIGGGGSGGGQPQQQQRKYEDYYREQPPNMYSQGLPDSGLKGVDHAMHNLDIKGDSSKDSQPKKTTTWASIASQPAKPQPPIQNHGMKKKGPGMPPGPIVPGKHNMDIGTWETNKSTPPPPVLPAPPPPPPPQHQQQQQLPPPFAMIANNGGNNGNSGGGANLSNIAKAMVHRHHPPMNIRPPPPALWNPPPSARQPSQMMTPSPIPQPHYQMQQSQHQQISLSLGCNSNNSPIGGGGGGGVIRIMPPSNPSPVPHPQPPTLVPHHHQQQQQQPIMEKSVIVPAAVTIQQQQLEQNHPVLDKLRVKNNYNPPDFDLNAPNARFFVIKSYSEDDIHRSIKYEIWCSTEYGNKRLDQAFRERETEGGVIYLFFSVNGSGHFCGMAQMVTPIDYNANSSVWAQDKWKGQFKVRWIYVKDVPNGQLRYIRLENNEYKPVTNSRDTQEVPHTKGLQVLRIMHQFKHTTSIFDDFIHYEKRQEEEVCRRTTTTTSGDGGVVTAATGQSSLQNQSQKDFNNHHGNNDDGPGGGSFYGNPRDGNKEMTVHKPSRGKYMDGQREERDNRECQRSGYHNNRSTDYYGGGGYQNRDRGGRNGPRGGRN